MKINEKILEIDAIREEGAHEYFNALSRLVYEEGESFNKLFVKVLPPTPVKK